LVEGERLFAYVDTAYNNGTGIPTIGIGINLREHGQLILQALGFDLGGTVKLWGQVLRDRMHVIVQDLTPGSAIAHRRARKIRPHIARIDGRQTPGLDARTTRHAGYATSQRKRKRIEEIFGWMKTVGGFRKTRFIGQIKTQFAAYMVGAAYNLLRPTSALPRWPDARSGERKLILNGIYQHPVRGRGNRKVTAQSAGRSIAGGQPQPHLRQRFE
jgi:hypothetical protein